MKRIYWLIVVVVVVGLFSVLHGQETSASQKVPALTDVQKLTIQSAAKDVEIWQLRAQQATSEYQKAQAALQQYVASVTPAGYQITDKLELVPVPVPTHKAE